MSRSFPRIEELMAPLVSQEGVDLPLKEKLHRVCHLLLDQIQQASSDEFVLIPVVDYIERVRRLHIVEGFHIQKFELWLNHTSRLSLAEQAKIRGKIAGRYVPRDAYQVMFPIGMGTLYEGTHVVTAHRSPDLDTTVASFWGWLDAYAARISHGLHVWNLPGGKPPQQAETSILFLSIFGPHLFDIVCEPRTELAVTALDLVQHKGIVYRSPHDSAWDGDPGHPVDGAIVVGQDGRYLGEWLPLDNDRVRTVAMLLNHCCRWYGHHATLQLMTSLSRGTGQPPVHAMTIRESGPAVQFSAAQKDLVHRYLQSVFALPQGIDSSFGELLGDLKVPVTLDLSSIVGIVERLGSAIEKVCDAVDVLDRAMQVKHEVLAVPPRYVGDRAGLDEIRAHMNDHPLLTVVTYDESGTPFPLGVIHAHDLMRPFFGTVSLRDFSNCEETKIPSYFQVISIIDHHKTAFTTTAPSVACIADTQSVNTLVAELSFTLSDRYSTGGMTADDIARQMHEVQQAPETPSKQRILRALLQKQLALALRGDYFVAYEREALEYRHYLYAILDDTDLLSKASFRDVECVIQLLNRIESLTARRELEVIHCDDIPRDHQFVSRAVSRLVQHEAMYALYSKVYLAKEELVDAHLASIDVGQLFSDTKEQNGCCRVGQTKLFPHNITMFQKHVQQLQKAWLQSAHDQYQHSPSVDFHLHMISTIPGARELYEGKRSSYAHQDELWIWAPLTEIAQEHLRSFLSHWSLSPALRNLSIQLELIGPDAERWARVCRDAFHGFSSLSAVIQPRTTGDTFMVVRYPAGNLNSRKAVVSPYLPTILT